jgi:predicted RNase H-like HicB family nuclease
MTNYPINLFYSEEDKGWIADIPDLPHCSAFGDSPMEALNQVLVAQEAWLEAARAAGHSIPVASGRSPGTA